MGFTGAGHPVEAVAGLPAAAELQPELQPELPEKAGLPRQLPEQDMEGLRPGGLQGWREQLSSGISATNSWLDLGSLLYITVKSHPGGVGLFLAQFEALTAPTQRQRDVLPLPLPPLGRFHKYIKSTQSTAKAKQRRQQKAKLGRKACSDVWLWLVVFPLNYEFYGSAVPDIAAVNTFSDLTAGQKSCIHCSVKVFVVLA